MSYQIEKNTMEYTILSMLAEGSAYVNELLSKIEKTTTIDNSKFYPTLSKLSNWNLLCYNWNKTENDQPVKEFILTIDGQNILSTIK